MELHHAPNVSLAWLIAANSLLRRSTNKSGRQAWDLGVEIADPAGPESSDIRIGLDAELSHLGLQSIDTVANTIFPANLSLASRDRAEFFSRYRGLVPRLRKFPGNHHGLYFDRLTAWPPGTLEPINQVDLVISRLISERSGGGHGPLRFVYDMAVFSPNHDPRPIGFPCLAYLNVKLDGDRVRLTAHYRNHYFVERAYGNYLGLARLQGFIASEAGLEVGSLTCISGHAELEEKNAKTHFASWLRSTIKEHAPE